MLGLDFFTLIGLIIFLALSFAGFYMLARNIFYRALDSNNSRLNLFVKLGMSVAFAGILEFTFYAGINSTYSSTIKTVVFIVPPFLITAMMVFSALINIKETILSTVYTIKFMAITVVLLAFSYVLGLFLLSSLFRASHPFIKSVVPFVPVLLMIWKVNPVRRQIANWHTSLKTKFSMKPYSLVLRSFSDKTPLEAPGSLSVDSFGDSINISWIEGSSVLTNLNSALTKFGPVAVLGEFTFSNESDIGNALQIRSNDENWKCKINKLAKNAALIVIVPSSSKGVLWETNYLIEQDLLNKTLVFMPVPLFNNVESNEMELVDHWEKLAAELKPNGIHLPDYEGAGFIYRPEKDLSIKQVVYMDEVPQYKITSEIFKSTKRIAPENNGETARLKDVVRALKDC